MIAEALKVLEQEDTRGYKQIISGQLLVVKVLQPWELSKTIFKDNRTKPKYPVYVKHSVHSTFRKDLELWTMKKRARCSEY